MAVTWFTAEPEDAVTLAVVGVGWSASLLAVGVQRP